jgi:hypothetical protein
MIRKAIATACCIGMAATGVVASSTAATAAVTDRVKVRKRKR